ncbi:MAG TPA: hypothetical protein V6C81_14710 [Planktothrix sp.]|jgi:hypothetical protein
MKQQNRLIREVALPWSDGLLSAKLWMVGERTAVGVPELGLHCYGSSQPEAVFRLFNSLLKYYRQLKTYKNRLSERGLHHLELLTCWVNHIEERMTAPADHGKVLTLTRK